MGGDVGGQVEMTTLDWRLLGVIDETAFSQSPGPRCLGQFLSEWFGHLDAVNSEMQTACELAVTAVVMSRIPSGRDTVW